MGHHAFISSMGCRKVPMEPELSPGGENSCGTCSEGTFPFSPLSPPNQLQHFSIQNVTSIHCPPESTRGKQIPGKECHEIPGLKLESQGLHTHCLHPRQELGLKSPGRNGCLLQLTQGFLCQSWLDLFTGPRLMPEVICGYRRMLNRLSNALKAVLKTELWALTHG